MPTFASGTFTSYLLTTVNHEGKSLKAPVFHSLTFLFCFNQLIPQIILLCLSLALLLGSVMSVDLAETAENTAESALGYAEKLDFLGILGKGQSTEEEE